jgi:hypothetical protein
MTTKYEDLEQLVKEQKENKPLWFFADSPQEGDLQQALRQLHEAIEFLTGDK